MKKIVFFAVVAFTCEVQAQNLFSLRGLAASTPERGHSQSPTATAGTAPASNPRAVSFTAVAVGWWAGVSDQ